MNDYQERDKFQIIRIDARACFVESLSDSFGIGKAHFCFATYDMSKAAGSRQTNNVNIYIDIAEAMELCQSMGSGELRFVMNQRRATGDTTPLRQWLGGTSAGKLRKLGRPRPDGKSLSRTAKILCGTKSDFLFVADSGPGEENKTGLIVPRFGDKPENHVSVSMTWQAMSHLMLMTQAHYQSWLTAKYMKQSDSPATYPAVPPMTAPAVDAPMDAPPEGWEVIPGDIYLPF